MQEVPQQPAVGVELGGLALLDPGGGRGGQGVLGAAGALGIGGFVEMLLI